MAQTHQTHSGATYGCPNITHQFWSKLVIGNIQKITAVRTIRMVTTSFSITNVQKLGKSGIVHMDNGQKDNIDGPGGILELL